MEEEEEAIARVGEKGSVLRGARVPVRGLMSGPYRLVYCAVDGKMRADTKEYNKPAATAKCAVTTGKSVRLLVCCRGVVAREVLLPES